MAGCVRVLPRRRDWQGFAHLLAPPSILRPAPLSAGLVLALAVAACGDDGRGAAAAGNAAAGEGDTGTVVVPWRSIIDTVGDTIVVRTVGATDEAAVLRLVEELRIGELDGGEDYQFADVRFVRPASGNGVYVWDRTIGLLRQYDADGRFVRHIGGVGSGPGEYRGANGLVQLGDGRLLLWDPENLRLNVYDSSGTVAGSWRYGSTLGVTSPWGMLADTADNVYVSHWFRPTDTTRLTLADRRGGYRVLGPDGVVRDSVPPPSWLPRATLIVAETEGGGGGIRSPVPFAPQPSWTVSRYGYLVSGVGDRYAITLHRPGAPLRIERELDPVPVDPDERADAEQIAIAAMRRMDRSWRWNGPPIPDVKQFFSAIHPAADGRLWVQRATRGIRTGAGEAPPPALVPPVGGGGTTIPIPPPRWHEPVVFDVFAADGRFLGALVMPERARVLHMQGDHVWGVERDEMDVPFVVRWRIAPSLASRESGTR